MARLMTTKDRSVFRLDTGLVKIEVSYVIQPRGDLYGQWNVPGDPPGYVYVYVKTLFKTWLDGCWMLM